MIYKSRQVNLDPEPWVHYAYDGFSHERRASPEPLGEIEGGVADLKPRPEFEPTRDPFPWLDPEEGQRYSLDQESNLFTHEEGDYDLDAWPFVQWAPRREQFDAPVNRVLVDFRKHWEPLAPAPGPREAQIYLEVTDLDGGKKQPLYWSTKEIDHARRVLTRLASWKAATDG